MTNPHHQKLLHQIGQSLGIALEFDENNQCFLLLDEQLMVSVRSLDDAWILYGMLGNLEENEAREDAALALLSLNLNLAEAGEASIALEESSGVIMLIARVDTTDMDSEHMQEILGNFVSQLSNTIALLNGEQPAEDSPSPPPAFPLDMGFFNRA